VVTSPMTSSRTWHGDRERWLREHFGIEPNHVIHAAGDRKALVRGDLLVEPVGAPGGQHDHGPRCQAGRKLDTDLAAAAEDHDRSGPRVTHTSRLFTALAWRPMANPTTRLTSDALAFLTERHLAMLTTLRADNSPHVVAVGFTFDPKTHIARVITSDGSQKAINAERSGVGVLSQVDGARWLSLEGRAGVNRDPAAVRDAELRYAQRYRTPRENPKRVVIEVHVTRVLGSSGLLDHTKR